MAYINKAVGYLQAALWFVLPVALVCNAIVFSSDTLPALAFFHLNPTFALVLYGFVLTSWFVMYFSSGLQLLNEQSEKKKTKEVSVPAVVEGIALLNVVLNGLTLMGGIAAFMTFCERYGILSAVFLSGNFWLVSGFFFLAGVIASYSLTYQNIKKAWPTIADKASKGEIPVHLALSFVIAFFTAVSSALFALYCTPLVGLFHIVVPWQLVLARISVTVLAFIAAFGLYFVSLNDQLEKLSAFCKKLVKGKAEKPSASQVFFMLISIVAATAFCFTSYHQFAVLFTITNANRGFIIAEVCCQWFAFAMAYVYSYNKLVEELGKCLNFVFAIEHMVVATLLIYSASCLLMPAMVPVIGYSFALLISSIVVGLVMYIDHYIDRAFSDYKVGQGDAGEFDYGSIHATPSKEGIFKLSEATPDKGNSSTSSQGATSPRTPIIYHLMGEETCDVGFSPADKLVDSTSMAKQFVLNKIFG